MRGAVSVTGAKQSCGRQWGTETDMSCWHVCERPKRHRGKCQCYYCGRRANRPKNAPPGAGRVR